MNKTLLMMQVLDAQLTVLNIEGIRSEYQIYEYEETETDEIPCEHCQGEGEIPNENFDLLPCDDPNDVDDWLFGDPYIECEHCEGTGTILENRIVKFFDSWTESNIFI